MQLSGIIPSTLLPIRDQNNDDGNPRRVTLVHKNKDSLVAILSRGIEEVDFEKPIEDESNKETIKELENL
ncbi:MAG: hypothetical protein WCH78_14985 [Bacteroidota bacterium]